MLRFPSCSHLARLDAVIDGRPESFLLCSDEGGGEGGEGGEGGDSGDAGDAGGDDAGGDANAPGPSGGFQGPGMSDPGSLGSFGPGPGEAPSGGFQGPGLSDPGSLGSFGPGADVGVPGANIGAAPGSFGDESEGIGVGDIGTAALAAQADAQAAMADIAAQLGIDPADLSDPTAISFNPQPTQAKAPPQSQQQALATLAQLASKNPTISMEIDPVTMNQLAKEPTEQTPPNQLPVTVVSPPRGDLSTAIGPPAPANAVPGVSQATGFSAPGPGAPGFGVATSGSLAGSIGSAIGGMFGASSAQAAQPQQIETQPMFKELPPEPIKGKDPSKADPLANFPHPQASPLPNFPPLPPPKMQNFPFPQPKTVITVPIVPKPFAPQPILGPLPNPPHMKSDVPTVPVPTQQELQDAKNALTQNMPQTPIGPPVPNMPPNPNLTDPFGPPAPQMAPNPNLTDPFGPVAPQQEEPFSPPPIVAIPPKAPHLPQDVVAPPIAKAPPPTPHLPQDVVPPPVVTLPPKSQEQAPFTNYPPHNPYALPPTVVAPPLPYNMPPVPHTAPNPNLTTPFGPPAPNNPPNPNLTDPFGPPAPQMAPNPNLTDPFGPPAPPPAPPPAVVTAPPAPPPAVVTAPHTFGPLATQTLTEFDQQTAHPGQNLGFTPGSNLSGFGSFGAGKQIFGQSVTQLTQSNSSTTPQMTQQWSNQIASMSNNMPANTKFNLLAAAQSTRGAILSDPDVQRAVQLQRWDIVDSFANVANTSVNASTPIQFGPRGATPFNSPALQ